MTCPGGCIGVEGSPRVAAKRRRAEEKRIEGLYRRDSGMELRTSHENKEIIELYREFYKKPLE